MQQIRENPRDPCHPCSRLCDYGHEEMLMLLFFGLCNADMSKFYAIPHQ
jgi:hypothetical protein